MLYWGILSVKNQIPLTVRSLTQGARTVAETSIPYLGVDYYVANKAKKRYALPIWSGAELAWNVYFALRNYLSR